MLLPVARSLSSNVIDVRERFFVFSPGQYAPNRGGILGRVRFFSESLHEPPGLVFDSVDLLSYAK